MQNLSKVCCGTLEEFENNQEKYKDYDIVYGTIQRNAGVGYHRIPVYRKPEEMTDYEVAVAIDGFFYDVINCGGILECWYD